MGPPDLTAVPTSSWKGEAGASGKAGAGGAGGVSGGSSDEDNADGRGRGKTSGSKGASGGSAKRSSSEGALGGHGLPPDNHVPGPDVFYINAAAWLPDLRAKVALLQARQPKTMVAPYPHPQGIPPLGVNLELLQLKAEMTQRRALQKLGRSTKGCHLVTKATDSGPLRGPPEALERPLRPWRTSQHFAAMNRKSAGGGGQPPAMFRGRSHSGKMNSKPGRPKTR